MSYYTCNDNTKALLQDFIDRNAAEPERHNIDAWMTDAEWSANNALPGGAVIIEMSGRHARSGNPVTLNLRHSDFDAVETVDE